MCTAAFISSCLSHLSKHTRLIDGGGTTTVCLVFRKTASQLRREGYSIAGNVRGTWLLIWLIRKGFSLAKYSSNTIHAIYALVFMDTNRHA